QILLQPLAECLPLRATIEEMPGYTPWWQQKNGNFPLDFSVLLGQIDNLSNTTQPPLMLDFPGKRGGHTIVLGAPGSGKTTFLRTLASSLSFRYSPAQAVIYVLSFAGHSLDGLTRLPNVGDVIHGNEPERISRLLRLLHAAIEERKVLMGGLQVDSLEKYNHHPRVTADQRLPAIFVMIDNFGELRDTAFEDEMGEIQKLLENGRNYGIFFILTALQFAGIPYKTQNIIDQRIALNLTDRSDYALFVGRLQSLDFDVLPPGRGFLYGIPPLSIQLADIGDISEDVDASSDPEKPGSLFGEIVANGKSWKGPRPTAIGVLPEWVNLSSLYPQASKPTCCLVGIDSDTLSPLKIEWTPGTHLMIGGPPQSGRTSVLH
ncbi:MAG: FtsK/SpoIIIE domain-containing protein, partial [Anaerolineaceae bacterium]